MERPTPFVICALWIYPCNDRTMRRILNDGLYYLNDYITISSGINDDELRVNEHRLPDGWFKSNISVQAIVGKNGSGKSSLLDYVYRIANNFGLSIEMRIEELNKKDSLLKPLESRCVRIATDPLSKMWW